MVRDKQALEYRVAWGWEAHALLSTEQLHEPEDCPRLMSSRMRLA